MGEHVVSGVVAHRTTVDVEPAAELRKTRFQARCLECSWVGERRATRSFADLDADEHARGTVQR